MGLPRLVRGHLAAAVAVLVLGTALDRLVPALRPWLTGEDHLIEDLQVALFGAVAVLAGRGLFRSGPAASRRACAVMAAAGLLLALEELDFGQRLLGLQPPRLYFVNGGRVTVVSGEAEYTVAAPRGAFPGLRALDTAIRKAVTDHSRPGSPSTVTLRYRVESIAIDGLHDAFGLATRAWGPAALAGLLAGTVLPAAAVLWTLRRRPCFGHLLLALVWILVAVVLDVPREGGAPSELLEELLELNGALGLLLAVVAERATAGRAAAPGPPGRR